MLKLIKSKIVIGVGFLLALYTLFGFIILPYLIQKNFSSIIRTTLGVNGYLKKVYINPYTFEVELKSLLIQDKKHNPLLQFTKLALDFEFTSLFRDEVVVKYLYVDYLKANIVVDKTGQINLQEILDSLPKSKSNTKNTSSIKNPFYFTIDDIKLRNNNVMFIDNFKKKPSSIKTTYFDIDIKNISTKPTKKATIKTHINTIFLDNILSKKQKLTLANIDIFVDDITLTKEKFIKYKLVFNTPLRGKIDLYGSVKTNPLLVESKLKIDSFDTTPYVVYINDFVNISIKKGYISSAIDIKLKQNGKNIEPKVYGDFSLDKLRLYHSVTKQQLLDLEKLQLDGISYITNDLEIKNILIDTLKTGLFISKNKTTNIDNIIKNSSTKTVSKKKQNSKKNHFTYFIKNIDLKNSELDFSDFSLPLKFHTKIDNLKANIKAISSNDIETKLVLDGIVNRYGTAKIMANLDINNFKKSTDVKVNFENLNLIAVSGYSGKFLGKRISSGKLWLDLEYDIKDSNLTSANNIRIKDLELGKKVESNSSVNLPIGLAIALLEDSDGFIDLDIPIDGNIDNPQFHLAGTIWKTIGNVITNIVTAPFRFLGSLFGSDTDELGKIEFDYGDSDILITQKEKLDNLVKALKKKHKLSIKINPIYDISNDTKILQEKRFKELINKKDKAKIIKNMFIKKFSKQEYKKLLQDSKDNTISVVQSMSSRLISTINIPKITLEQLAKKRAKAISSYLINKGLSKDRISISKDIIYKENSKKRVTLKLDIEVLQ